MKNPNPASEMPRVNYTEQEISTNSLPPLVEPSYSAGPGSSFTDGESEFKSSNSSTLNNNRSTNPNNIVSNINYLTAVSDYQMNPNPNQLPVFNPHVQVNNSVFRDPGPANPSYYYNQLGNMNIAQCKVEPYQSRSMISGSDQYIGLSTNLNPDEILSVSNLKAEPLGVNSVPQFEDLIGPFINSTDSNIGFGFSWDY